MGRVFRLLALSSSYFYNRQSLSWTRSHPQSLPRAFPGFATPDNQSHPRNRIDRSHVPSHAPSGHLPIPVKGISPPSVRSSPSPGFLDSKKVSSCNTLEDADTRVLNQFPFHLIPVDSSRDKRKRDLRYIPREYKALRIREYDEITSLPKETYLKLRGGMLSFIV